MAEPGKRAAGEALPSERSSNELPIPPLEMREAVGPTDPAAFDNPDGRPIFPGLPAELYDSVFDFGCGCGRLARQLIQQQPRPRTYLGVDLNRPLVVWCQENLSPAAPNFEFRHHDVWYPGIWNAGDDKPAVASFPVADDSQTLVIAHSVFTHLIEAHAEYYLKEAARALSPSGVFYSTWFLFDKRLFPMMQDFQNALYINDQNPTNAVIFDRDWLVDAAGRNGLVVTAAYPPEVRGFHWRIEMMAAASGAEAVDLPPDEAPISVEGVRAAAVEPDLDHAED
jgi:SAM-dependent methyltransferase